MAATRSCEPNTFDRCAPIGQWLASDSFVTCCKTWQNLFLTKNVWYSEQGWSVHSMIWPISITKFMWLPLQHSCTLKSTLSWNPIKIVPCKRRNALWCTPPQLQILHRAPDASLFQMLNNWKKNKKNKKKPWWNGMQHEECPLWRNMPKHLNATQDCRL